MKELAGRLTALDPDAGAAVRVIAYFDRLAESRAGVEALVRGAAVLAGCPAGLVDPGRRVHVRVEADGTRRDTEAAPDPAWPCARLSPDSAAVLWLERGGGAAEPSGPAAQGLDARYAQAAAPHKGDARHAAVAPSVVDAVILERAAGAVRLVLDRTRGRAPADDPALVETLLDATAPEPARLHAARRLGLDPAAPARALAPLNGRPRVMAAGTEAVPDAGRTAAEATAPWAGLTSPAAAPRSAAVRGTANTAKTAATAEQPRPEAAPARPNRAGGATPSRTDDPAHPAPARVARPRDGAEALAPEAQPAHPTTAHTTPAPRDDAGALPPEAQPAHPTSPHPRTNAGTPTPDTQPATAVQATPRSRTGSAAVGPAATVTGLQPPAPDPRLPAGRLGVGPAVPVLELPRSWAEARTALRFTAEGTPQDPGPRVVYADELGGIALLAGLVAPGSEPPPDVRALETAAATAPWLPATLHAVASTTSLRAAAAGINVHHSTLQDRLAHAEHLLGWPIRTPQGRLRLQLALTMRHLARP